MVPAMEKGLLEELSYYFNPHQFMAERVPLKNILMGMFNWIGGNGNNPPGTAYNRLHDRLFHSGSAAPAPAR